MFTPHRSTNPGRDPSTADQSTMDVVTLQFSGHSVTVTHDGFTIGASQQCDLRLDDPALPGMHSVIHMQSGALWIEGADESVILTVNDRPYRRMALRHEDRMQIGSTDITILLNGLTPAIPQTSVPQEDLTLLTAEELCDRILSEQSMVSDFIDGQRSGWEALLCAIESANEEPAINNTFEQQTPVQNEEQVTINALLEQIQDLNQSITGQTQQLSEQEKQLVESASLIEQSQHQAVQHLDEILEKLKNSDPPHEHELRASA